MQYFENVSIPINVTVRLETTLPENGNWLNGLAQTWQQSLLDYATVAFADRRDVRVLGAQLRVIQESLESLPPPPPIPRTRSLQWSKRQTRRLNGSTTVTTTTARLQGDLDMAVDTRSVQPETFVPQAKTELESTVLSVPELQRAIDKANTGSSGTATNIIVTDISSPNDMQQPRDTSESPSSNDKPSKASIVVGFTLLVATLASLVFWAHVLWKKHKKHQRKRKLDSLRQAQSVTYQMERPGPTTGPSKQQDQRNAPAYPRQSLNLAQQRQQQTPIRTLTSDGSGSSAYPGIASMSEDDDGQEIYRDASEDASSVVSADPFGKELQRAASLDRAVWDEMLRKNQALESQQSTLDSTSMARSLGQETADGIANVGNVSMFAALGSEDMGMEVEPRGTGLPLHGSFPYGDEREKYNPSTEPIHLTSDNAVKWTEAGITLPAITTRGRDFGAAGREKAANDAPFSPYGDDKERSRSLEESWDLDAYPVKDERGPLQYSFLYPLKGRSLDEDVPDARRSPDSDASVRESLEVTSVGSVDFRTRHVEPKVDMDDMLDENDEPESELTVSMLKEVQEIANYVKLYEKRKAQQNPMLGTAPASSSNPGLQYRQLNDSGGSNQRPSTKEDLGSTFSSMVPPASYVPAASKSVADYGLAKVRSDDSSQEMFSDTEDDSSQRLGISRISVEKPPGHLLSYKSSQDDPLQFDLSSSDLVSPFPSSDLDSLRYSPSHSFDKQLTTTNYQMESLLDGPRNNRHAHRGANSDDSDESDDQLPSAPDNDAANILKDLRTNPVAGRIERYTEASVECVRPSKKIGYRSRDNTAEHRHPIPQEDSSRYPQRLQDARQRNTLDRSFQNIRSKFESHPTQPIVPPNESVSA
jgi:hypothetical protein